MESTASLISPSSPVSASTFSFSPLHSPRHQQHFHTMSPSTSPSPSPRRAPSFADNLELSSSSSSMWNTPRPCVPLQPPPEFAFSKSCSRPTTETTAYTTTTSESTRTRTSTSTSSETRKPRHMPTSTPENHYSTLGVARHATGKEIRGAYRKLALQYHPDVSPLHRLDTSTKVFAEINEAYATLSDPHKRQLYDLKLALESPISEHPITTSMAYSYPMSSSSSSSPLSYSSATSSPTSNSSSPMWASSPASSPREYTHAATGRVYPSMNSFYREWRRGAHAS